MLPSATSARIEAMPDQPTVQRQQARARALNTARLRRLQTALTGAGDRPSVLTAMALMAQNVVERYAAPHREMISPGGQTCAVLRMEVRFRSGAMASSSKISTEDEHRSPGPLPDDLLRDYLQARASRRSEAARQEEDAVSSGS